MAGAFYPADPTELTRLVDRLVHEATPPEVPRPDAVVSPHAAYQFSGSVAAVAYAALAGRGPDVRRVVVAGPLHWALGSGVAVPAAKAMRTPLGDLEVDGELRDRALAHPGVVADGADLAREHSLEVQLPFLQRTLGDVTVLPLGIRHAGPDDLAGLLEHVAGEPDTALVVTTDLSHDLPYERARAVDRETVDRALRGEPVLLEAACGAQGLNGLVELARRRGLAGHLLDLRNSGDTAGPRDPVVGYTALAFSGHGDGG